MRELKVWGEKVVSAFKSGVGKVAVGSTAMVGVAGSALAQTGPGDAIATELASGNTQIMVVIGAVAILLGILIVWSYIKRAR